MGFMLTLCKHAWPIVHADYEKFMNTMPYYSIISAWSSEVVSWLGHVLTGGSGLQSKCNLKKYQESGAY